MTNRVCVSWLLLVISGLGLIPFADRLAVAPVGTELVLFIVNFDEMLCFPNQVYPKHGYGGSLTPVGNWAYVHE